MAEAAQSVRSATADLTDGSDRRTTLAATRTLLAAERTYAAWVRTALTALASGVGARALLDRLIPDWLAAATGSVLVAFAAFCLIAAIWRQADDGVPPPRPQVRQIPRPFLIALNGFLLLVAIAVLIGIWTV